MINPAAALSTRLVEEIDRFKLSRGRFHARLTPGQEYERAEHYLDPDFLRARTRHTIPPLPGGREPDETEIRAGASRFVRTYCQTLVRPVLVALGRGIGVDASLDRATITWRTAEVRGTMISEPNGFHVEERDLSIPASRDAVLRALFADHLAIIFEQVLQIAKLSPQVFWASAAEAAASVLMAAAEQLDAETAQPLISVCEDVLTAEMLPGIPGPNPMLGLVHREDVARADFPYGLMLRKVCCICFKLPDRKGLYCGTCPIPTTDWLTAFIRESVPAPAPVRNPATVSLITATRH